MANDPVTGGENLATEALHLINDILNKKDRDEPNSENTQLKTAFQVALGTKEGLDSDDGRLLLERLCIEAGNPIAPPGDIGEARRNLTHALVLNTIDLIRERRINTRLLAALTERKA